MSELAPGIDECAGVDGGGLLNFGPLNLGGGTAITGATCVPSSANLVNVDVNADAAIGPLPGWNDWAKLFYNFQSLDNFVDGAAGSADGSQLDFSPQDLEAVQAATEAQTAPELAAVITAPDSAPNGTTVTATLGVENSGRGPAFALEGALDDPDGVEISSISQSQLNVGETTPGSSGTYTIPADACPTTLTFTAGATGFGLAHIEQTVTAVHELEVLDIAVLMQDRERLGHRHWHLIECLASVHARRLRHRRDDPLMPVAVSYSPLVSGTTSPGAVDVATISADVAPSLSRWRPLRACAVSATKPTGWVAM